MKIILVLENEGCLKAWEIPYIGPILSLAAVAVLRDGGGATITINDGGGTRPPLLPSEIQRLDLATREMH